MGSVAGWTEVFLTRSQLTGSASTDSGPLQFIGEERKTERQVIALGVDRARMMYPSLRSRPDTEFLLLADNAWIENLNTPQVSPAG